MVSVSLRRKRYDLFAHLNAIYDTATMAELYAAQGHTERAVEIYEKLTVREPENLEHRARLRALQSPEGGPMVFRREMENIVNNTPGALACTVMGFDGIPIDTVESESGGVDVSTFMTEFAATVNSLRVVAQSGGEENLHEITLESDKLFAVLRILNKDYFLGTICESTGLTGKARFLMKMAAPVLRKEF